MQMKFTWWIGWKASASLKKSKLQIHRSQKKHLHNEYQGSADTTITKRASATANIKPVQIQWLPQRHLYKQINPGYRDTSDTRKVSFRHRSTYFDHSTPQSKKKTMQSSELESGLPDEAPAEVHSLFLLRSHRELHSHSYYHILHHFIMQPSTFYNILRQQCSGN